MADETQQPTPTTPPQVVVVGEPKPVVKRSTVTGAALGAAWGLLGGPPGIIVGAVTGGIIGHFWGAEVKSALKKMVNED